MNCPLARTHEAPHCPPRHYQTPSQPQGHPAGSVPPDEPPMASPPGLGSPTAICSPSGPGQTEGQ